MTNKQIKTLARIKLRGNWGNSIALVFCIFAVALLIIIGGYFVLSMYAYLIDEEFSVSSYLHDPVNLGISVTAILLLTAVLSMIYFVIVRQFIDISKGADFSEKRNSVYKRPLLLMKITLIPQFAKLVIIILASIPGIFAVDFANNLTARAKQSSITFILLLLFMVSLLVVILSAILVLACILSLHLLPVIIMLHPAMPLGKAIKICFKATDSNRIRMLLFYLSFIKFLPLLLLVYPGIIIIPYFAMSDIVLISSILDEDLKKDEFFDVFPQLYKEKENL